jgi:Holliday junction resolvase RusA-like endonuclease
MNPNDYSIEDFMEVQSTSGTAISFVMAGNPPVQERHRIALRSNTGAWRPFPVIYDPSSAKKKDYAAQVRTAMVDYGLAHPYFDTEHAITLEVTFVLPRRKKDWIKRAGFFQLTSAALTFPRGKDVDNMLKFVMDALQGVLFANDVTITKVIATKLYPEKADARGWTEVQFSTSSQPPPLATGGVWA